MKKQWLVLGIVLFFVATIILGNQFWAYYKSKKQSELAIRKLALSINLEKEKQEKITDFEIERQELLKDAKAKYAKNKNKYITEAKLINGNFQRKIEPLLDSVQKIKYQKYKAAAARKRIAKMEFKKMFGNRKRQQQRQ